jgi:hypothetical protein
MRYFGPASAVAILASVLALPTASAAAPTGAPLYKITKTVPLGGTDGWDYLYFEPQSHRVYVAHSTEITVVDGHNGDIVGRVQGISRVNGVTAIPELGKGYTDSRDKKAAVAFDLNSFMATKDIPADTDTDAVIYDPATRRVFVMNGDGMDATVIDATNDQGLANIPLQGKPEYLVSDNAGYVYINITDKREIVRLDARSLKIDARWPIPECEGPHGLAMDREAHRLFASCVNKQLVVVDAQNGKIVATLPIGRGTDAAAFDSKRKLVFSSNGEGTLSIISEQGPDKFVSLGEVQTKPFARTMALDPATGRIYLVTAELDEINPQAENLRQRYAIRRGTVELLFLDPSS